jgi:hypothetical protein
MTELRDFVLTFCRLAGGIVEPPAYGVYEVLWPESVAARLGMATFQRLAFEEEEERDDGVTRLSYGHALVEEMAEAAVAAPASASLHINAVRLEKRGLADLARRTLKLANARLAQAPRQAEARALHHYIRFTFKAALITDEKHEQLVSVLMDAQNGYPVPELADLEHQTILESENAFENLPLAQPRWLPKSETNPLSRPALEGLLERATHAARDALADSTARLTRRAARFLELDRARLNQYYDDIERDLTRRRDRATDESRRTSIQDKLEAAQAERQAKLADVEAKYRLRVELQLLNLLVITLPKLTLQVEIKHRTTRVTRTVVWNPLLHQVEPLFCDVCGRPVTRLTLCSSGHLVHTDGDCLLADDQQCVDCKRLFCRRCADQMEACVVCGRPVCRHSLNHCADCGRGTCREHVGLCHAADGAPLKIEPEVASPPATAVEPPPPPEPEPKVQEKRPRLSSAKRQAAERAAQRRQRRTPHRRSTRPKGPKAAKIEVYVDSELPRISAFVLSSGNKEIAVRTWEMVDEGIGVWCHCEKGWRCPADRTLLEPAPPDEIDRQLWGEISALRQEYKVSPRKVSVYNVIRDTPRPASRLVLRGTWKEWVGS